MDIQYLTVSSSSVTAAECELVSATAVELVDGYLSTPVDAVDEAATGTSEPVGDVRCRCVLALATGPA